MRRSLIQRYCSGLLVLLLLTPAVSACSGSSGTAQQRALKLAPISQLPPEVQQGPPEVREAYQFAVANPEYLTNFPCYCGCGGMGHKSNRDCYIRAFNPDGSIVFDNHAFF